MKVDEIEKSINEIDLRGSRWFNQSDDEKLSMAEK